MYIEFKIRVSCEASDITMGQVTSIFMYFKFNLQNILYEYVEKVMILCQKSWKK